MTTSIQFQVAAFPWPLVISQHPSGQAALAFVWNDELVASPFEGQSGTNVEPDFYDLTDEEVLWYFRFSSMLKQPAEHSTLTHLLPPESRSWITAESLPLWEIVRAGGDSMIDVCVLPASGGTSVAQVTTCTGDGRFTAESIERGEINANLLAAAPLLFNQLRTLCTRYALALGPELADKDNALQEALIALRDTHPQPSAPRR
jgi:hypothetical protein